MANIPAFRRYYYRKKNLSSFLLSHMTPFILLFPTSGTKRRVRDIKRAVKSVIISQDSDVIIFNKIVALVLFAPNDDKDSKDNKFNFMRNTGPLFNQGAVWKLNCGWTGPGALKLKKVINVAGSWYSTWRTLMKTNLVLQGTKYVGTLLFARHSFLAFKDAVIPMDSVVRGFLKLKTVKLTLRDWLLDGLLMNQQASDGRLGDILVNKREDREKLTLNFKKKKELSLKKFRNVLLKNLFGTLPFSVTRFLKRKTDLLIKELVRLVLKKQTLLMGIKWATVRYILSVFLDLIFSELKLTLYINSLGIDQQIKNRKSKGSGKGKYFAPSRVLLISIWFKDQVQGQTLRNHILHINKDKNKLSKSNIVYLKDYKQRNSFAFDSKNLYVFDDRGDTLIDLYLFNKKIYLTNILERLANINDYKMTGFPPIKIKFDDITILQPLKKKSGLIISVVWSFPTKRPPSEGLFHIFYDKPNLLFNSFRILTPANNQMLKINEVNFLLNIQTKIKNQLLVLGISGIINSLKKIIVPLGNTKHVKLKHNMFTNLVKMLNPSITTETSKLLFTLILPSKDAFDNGEKIAGQTKIKINNGNAMLYYFSSNLTHKRLTLFTKSLFLNDIDGYNVLKLVIRRLLPDSRGDISRRLLSYLRNSLNISFNVHGVFGIPVFKSYVVTHNFPGPRVNKARWIDGKYIITHQSTKVDKNTIVTTIKGKRVPLTDDTIDKNKDKILEGEDPITTSSLQNLLQPPQFFTAEASTTGVLSPGIIIIQTELSSLSGVQ